MNIFSIFNKEEKQVGYIELVYDLIFVYMVGQDNALLHHIKNGFVPASTFIVYVLCTLAIIQVWNFSTIYINMYGRGGVRDHVFLLVNMYLMYFLGTSTRLNTGRYIPQYHIAWGLILFNIGLQYFLEMRNHRQDVWNCDTIRRMGTTLWIEAAIVFVAAGAPSQLVSTVLSLAAVLAGIALTFVSRSTSAGGRIDFAHLTERAMLYVVFTFGEMVIAIAGYFEGDGSFNASTIFFSLMAFLITVGLLFSYEIIYDHLVNREGEYSGMSYMLLHIFILFAMNNITVSFEFMRDTEVAILPKTLFMACSLVAYFLFLLLLSRHFKRMWQFDPKFAAGFLSTSAAFIVLMVLARHNMVLNIVLSVLYVFAIAAVLYRIKLAQDIWDGRIREPRANG